VATIQRLLAGGKSASAQLRALKATWQGLSNAEKRVVLAVVAELCARRASTEPRSGRRDSAQRALHSGQLAGGAPALGGGRGVGANLVASECGKTAARTAGVGETACGSCSGDRAKALRGGVRYRATEMTCGRRVEVAGGSASVADAASGHALPAQEGTK
jgi:hypothetical protein